MLLYWGVFTVGFIIGTIISFIMFSAKNPEDDQGYRDQIFPKANLNVKPQGAIFKSESTILNNSL